MNLYSVYQVYLRYIFRVYIIWSMHVMDDSTMIYKIEKTNLKLYIHLFEWVLIILLRNVGGIWFW